MSELDDLRRGLAAALERAAWRGHTTLPEAGPAAPETPAPPAPAEEAAAPAPAAEERLPQREIVPAPRPAAPSTPVPTQEQSPGGIAPATAATPASQRARANSASSLEELRDQVAACRACALCETRTQTVFADGSPSARVLFVGEAPGADEDRQGVPFVGRAGQLLTDIITKGMKLPRSEVYIANVLKCRPPENRDPEPAEKALCTAFLDRQIELVNPEVVIPLGRHAANHVLGTNETLGNLRGRTRLLGGRKVVPTFHPAYLLRSPDKKKECWQDIQQAMREIGLAP